MEVVPDLVSHLLLPLPEVWPTCRREESNKRISFPLRVHLLSFDLDLACVLRLFKTHPVNSVLSVPLLSIRNPSLPRSVATLNNSSNNTLLLSPTTLLISNKLTSINNLSTLSSISSSRKGTEVNNSNKLEETLNNRISTNPVSENSLVESVTILESRKRGTRTDRVEATSTKVFKPSSMRNLSLPLLPFLSNNNKPTVPLPNTLRSTHLTCRTLVLLDQITLRSLNNKEINNTVRILNMDRFNTSNSSINSNSNLELKFKR